VATKSTRKPQAKAMKLRDLAGHSRKEVGAGATGSGKIKFNE
jgi:hypothetical protein